MIYESEIYRIYIYIYIYIQCNIQCTKVNLVFSFQFIIIMKAGPRRKILQGGTKLLWGPRDRLRLPLKIEDLRPPVTM